MMMTDNEITFQIRGAVFDVYNELGPGLLESVYEEALCYELKKRGLKFERQMQVPSVHGSLASIVPYTYIYYRLY